MIKRVSAILLVVLVVAFLAPQSAVASCDVDYDVNGDGCVNSGDVAFLVNYLFADGPVPPCDGDVNGDGVVDPADIFWLNNFLQNGGGRGCHDGGGE